MNPRLEAALALAARGMAVFPLHYIAEHDGRLRCSCGNPSCENAGKHPYPRLAARGLHSATSDLAAVARWWSAGGPYNIGLRTGIESGIVVIDVDPRHGGDWTLIGLEAKFGSVPKTWRNLTGGGGEHILFRHPGFPVANSAGALGPGIDVKGDGGYIVAPPSRHISGRYYAIDVDHHPDDVSVASHGLRRGRVLEVRVHPDDLGKVIGRGGRTARALRTVIGSLAGGRYVRVDLLDVDEVR